MALRRQQEVTVDNTTDLGITEVLKVLTTNSSNFRGHKKSRDAFGKLVKNELKGKGYTHISDLMNSFSCLLLQPINMHIFPKLLIRSTNHTTQLKQTLFQGCLWCRNLYSECKNVIYSLPTTEGEAPVEACRLQSLIFELFDKSLISQHTKCFAKPPG